MSYYVEYNAVGNMGAANIHHITICVKHDILYGYLPSFETSLFKEKNVSFHIFYICSSLSAYNVILSQ